VAKVLDRANSNSVELIGFYGGDEAHALSAWTSTSRDLTDNKRGRIPKLLKTLAENGHHTPFEKSYLQFLVTCDTASHIHLIKHRIGVSINGESARYKELKEDKYYIPNDWPEKDQEFLGTFTKEAFRIYHETIESLVNKGLSRKRAKESARFFIPYSNQLVLDVGFNFRSFMHFQSLRNAPEAQTEIREIAQQMLWYVSKIPEFKYSLEAFGYATT
jgi:flavin-dependent thymidylate synthase